jgi:hypothetical protein
MKTCLLFGLLAMGPWLVLPVAAAVVPKITGTPVIDAPPLLDWPLDQGVLTPNLNDPTADLLHDLHGQIAAADLVLSTEGNYHMALKDIWPRFLAKFPDAPLANWFYTTSPPVPVEQIANQRLQIGNLTLTCRPAAVVATLKVMEKLGQAGLTEGPVLPLYQDRGVVILVKKGNPKAIHTVWDLGRQGVRLVTPNPKLEPGAFENYAGTLYHIAGRVRKMAGRAPYPPSRSSLVRGARPGRCGHYLLPPGTLHPGDLSRSFRHCASRGEFG